MQKILVGVAVLLTAAAVRAEGPDAKVKERLGEKTLAVLAGATRVEAYRISSVEKKADRSVAGFPVTATGKEQGEEFARKLAAALQDEKTLFGLQARCFLPGVGFKLYKGEEVVEVAICFTCDNLRIVTKDARGNEVHKASGAFGAKGGKGPARAALVKLARAAFPDDKEIQELKGE